MALRPIATLAEADDFYRCSPEYGTRLDPIECRLAASQLPVGDEARAYSLTGVTPPWNIPWQSTHGGCTVSVEINGPRNEHMESISFRPDTIRDTTQFLIDRCPQTNGLGGFITEDFPNLIRFFTESSNTIETFHQPFPPSSYFATVTVSDSSDLCSPGSKSYDVPGELTQFLAEAARGTPRTSLLNLLDEYMTVQLGRLYLSRSRTANWFDPVTANVEEENERMNYTCSKLLGSPAAVDCLHVIDTQLGFPGDILALKPESEKTYSYHSCNVTITSDKAISVTWSQIRSSIEALVNLCVESPAVPSEGGIASSLKSGIVAAVIAGFGSHALGQSNLMKRARLAPSGRLPVLPEGVNVAIAHAGRT